MADSNFGRKLGGSRREFFKKILVPNFVQKYEKRIIDTSSNRENKDLTDILALGYAQAEKIIFCIFRFYPKLKKRANWPE